MTELAGLTERILLAFMAKSGVREWEQPEVRQFMTLAALEMAANILSNSGELMAVTGVARQQTGTVKTIKASGGDAAMTTASLANGSYRQSAKLDLGSPFGQVYAVRSRRELAATPTAGNTLDYWWSPSTSATAGTDNDGGCSGTDAAYTGYSSNAAASVKQLIFIGSLVCTAQATATVQKGFVGYFTPPTRYGSLVELNGSGAAIHSSDTNNEVTLTPVEFTQEPS